MFLCSKNRTRKREGVNILYTPQQARVVSGKSATDMASALNISVSTYRNKELGKSEFTVIEADMFLRTVHMKPEDVDFLCFKRSKNRTK
jgi:DNA-binding XRE family transcriptional regulator